MVPRIVPEEQARTAGIRLRVRDARKAQKLSLAVLSARTGEALSKSRIGNYERGLRRLGIEEARALAEALGSVSATYLPCPNDEGFLSGEELESLRSFRGTGERGRRTILGVAEAQPVGLHD